jgi:hypothetical protein
MLPSVLGWDFKNYINLTQSFSPKPVVLIRTILHRGPSSNFRPKVHNIRLDTSFYKLIMHLSHLATFTGLILCTLSPGIVYIISYSLN